MNSGVKPVKQGFAYAVTGRPQTRGALKIELAAAPLATDDSPELRGALGMVFPVPVTQRNGRIRLLFIL